MNITHRIQLPDLMKHLGLPLLAIEVGSAEAYNAKDLMEGGVEHLVMVDFWGNIPGQFGDGGHEENWHNKNYADAKERMAKYGDKVIMLKGKSVEMAALIEDNKYGLIYIDCDHSESAVLNDSEAYWSKLVPGGIMGYHDFDNPTYGVKQAVIKFAAKHGLEIHHLPENHPDDAGCYIIKPK